MNAKPAKRRLLLRGVVGLQRSVRSATDLFAGHSGVHGLLDPLGTGRVQQTAGSAWIWQAPATEAVEIQDRGVEPLCRLPSDSTGLVLDECRRIVVLYPALGSVPPCIVIRASVTSNAAASSWEVRLPSVRLACRWRLMEPSAGLEGQGLTGSRRLIAGLIAELDEAPRVLIEVGVDAFFRVGGLHLVEAAEPTGILRAVPRLLLEQ
mmetsp:Transcript_41763/g.135077  ORF Transcript_41763/g.135077 Transcript_41763/m.135077 type:complete len:207 (+) Transcript_41763:845-1465(+)